MNAPSNNELSRDLDRSGATLPQSSQPSSNSSSNRRTSFAGNQRLYPWLLCASTLIAAFFCIAYITKPIIVTRPVFTEKPTLKYQNTGQSISTSKSSKSHKNPTPTSSNTATPTANNQIPPASVTSGFEETNIRVQHILDAESSSGDIHRIVIDVPVLYQSRNLRWSQKDTAHARLLLQRLEQFQEKTRSLRDEGKILLQDWNALMDASIPNQSLRADSPSLSDNLRYSIHTPEDRNSNSNKPESDKK